MRSKPGTGKSEKRESMAKRIEQHALLPLFRSGGTTARPCAFATVGYFSALCSARNRPYGRQGLQRF